MDDILINGKAIPMPSVYKLTFQDYDSAEAGRNLQGTLIRERVCTKRKITCQWNWLDCDDMALILQAVAPVFVNVRYYDPMYNKMMTGTFYAGDKEPELYAYNNEIQGYKNFTLNLIEQ